MSDARTFDIGQDIGNDFTKSSAPSARLRLHVKTPSSVLRKQYGAPGNMKTKTPTRIRVSATRERVWAFIKQRHPTHTEKRVARKLSEVAGEDISPRTTEKWRYRMPSGQHILLMAQAWPDFVAFVTASKEEDEAAIDAVDLGPLEKGLGELSKEPDK